MALLRVVVHRLLLTFLSVFIISRMCMCDVLDADKARFLGKHLISFTNNITDFIGIQKKFDDIGGSFVEINGSEVVGEFTERLEGRFEEKKEALRLVKEHAEKTKSEESKHEYDMERIKEEKDYYPYLNVKTDNDSLAINPIFSLDVRVNMTGSFVHVPTNIYAKSTKVLDIVSWTKSLDSVFIKNFNRSQQKILYQYYGDHEGVLRVYPGNNNNFSKILDLYDCRRRPWYVQSTSSPKDVVIIIDLSGSMIGSNIGIAKIATASLIDTLEENDFFNVITVNKNVTYMKPCLKYLLQATKKNKEKMKNLVQAIGVPKFQLNHTLGLKTAFRLLNSGAVSNRSYAGCNRAIMFITDGIESDYTEEKKLFEKFNKDKLTRVFTYLVGRKKSPDKKALLQMACENNGYFYTLETLGNVWDTVLEYLYVMSRPIAAERAQKKAMYTPVYLDSTGLGMIMSISMGVFNGNKRKSKFLGVAGTDITINSLNDIIPHTEFGVFGHAFVITNNGFIVLHPKLRLQTGRLPSPPNILLEDLENGPDADDISRVTRAMIDGKTDKNENNTVEVYFTYDDDDRKISVTNATYNYQRVNDTEFTAGIVISTAEQKQFDYERTDDNLLAKGIKALYVSKVNMSIPNITVDNYTFVSIAPWEYLAKTAAAQKDHPYSVKLYPTVDEIYEDLKDVSTWSELNQLVGKHSKRLISNLLVSAGLIAENNEDWVADEMRNDQETYESIFVATAAGYSKLFTYSNTSEPYDRDILKTAIFQHAFANPDAKVIFSAPYSDRYNPIYDQLVTVVAPIRRKDSVLAVTGLQFKGEWMKSLLENVTDSFDDEKHDCFDNDTRICALVDQNAYILASNLGPTYIGRFIGEQSVALVEKLTDTGVLKRITLDDTQASCAWAGHSRAAANLLLVPAKLIIKGLIYLFRTFAHIITHVSIFLVSMFQNGVKASGGDNPNIQISCTHRWPFYLFQRDRIDDFNRNPDKKAMCSENCNLYFRKIQIVPDTNLFFLEIEFDGGGCADQCRRLWETLHRTRKDDEHYCVNDTKTSTVETQKYRRRPQTCFNDTKPIPQVKYACGRAWLMTPSLWMFIMVLLLSIMATK